jgi:hypothetical protein
MAIFPDLQMEPIIQTQDKTRFDATKSYITVDEAAITLVEIQPNNALGFIDVTGNGPEDWFLDYQFTTVGSVSATVRITTDGAPVTYSRSGVTLLPTEDALFSTDKDLIDHEDDIMDYVRDGRNSFIDKHRLAQDTILDELNDANIRDSSGNRLTKAAILDVKEVKEWSKYYVLMTIFDSQSNVVGDIFDEKARMYEGKMLRAQSNGFLRLDRNGDGIDKNLVDTTAGNLNRRG